MIMPLVAVALVLHPAGRAWLAVLFGLTLGTVLSR